MQATFHDQEDDFLLLQPGEARSEGAQERPTRRRKQIKIARMVNVIANGALAVSDAVWVAKWSNRHAPSVESARNRSKRKSPRTDPNRHAAREKITIARKEDAVMLLAWIGSKLFRW